MIFMTFMTLKIALRAINRNKVRSALTMLGVIIGVAAVIAVVAIGQGAAHLVQKQMESMGNYLTVLPGATSSGAVSWGVGSSVTLTPVDEEAIARDCPSAKAVAAIVRTKAQLVYQNANWNPATVQGCDPSYLVVREWAIVDGEAFSDLDLKKAAQVCIVGETIVKNLFSGESPVGKLVRVKNLPFKVVGVLDKKGANAWGQDQDDVVLLPWTTCKKKLQGSTFNTIDQILATPVSTAATPILEEEMNVVLRANHRIKKDAKGQWEDDYQIRNMTEFLKAMTAQTQVMRWLLMGVAAVSLLVGGIGIMNIMLVSVTERTREIGLRMAVGARGIDILAQFLVEAMSLSGIGGLVGIAVGLGLSTLASWLAHWPSLVSWLTVVIAVLFSAVVGMLFGLYPAWRASQLDPIDALRYE
jgi:putative ABC transport system permease protein